MILVFSLSPLFLGVITFISCLTPHVNRGIRRNIQEKMHSEKKSPGNSQQRDYAVHRPKEHVLENLCHYHLMQGAQEMFGADPAAKQQDISLLRNYTVQNRNI